MILSLNKKVNRPFFLQFSAQQERYQPQHLGNRDQEASERHAPRVEPEQPDCGHHGGAEEVVEATAERRPLEEPRAEHVGKNDLLAADDEEKHPVDGGNDEYELGHGVVLRVDDVRDEAVTVD